MCLACCARMEDCGLEGGDGGEWLSLTAGGGMGGLPGGRRREDRRTCVKPLGGQPADGLKTPLLSVPPRRPRRNQPRTNGQGADGLQATHKLAHFPLSPLSPVVCPSPPRVPVRAPSAPLLSPPDILLCTLETAPAGEPTCLDITDGQKDARTATSRISDRPTIGHKIYLSVTYPQPSPAPLAPRPHPHPPSRRAGDVCTVPHQTAITCPDKR
ncbi:hypothetical protein C8Q80DRAFT_625775 [Daedaleopsis nitida]|nr:hypothetical protein C8Q80DRAFT_625775 [Daedaleopsis nitida]